MSELDQLKLENEAPSFLTEEGFKTLQNGYLLPSETPRQMYLRVAKAAAALYHDKDRLELKFFNIIWNNWLCISSPIAANLGTNRGLPISCNGISVSDNIDSIFQKNHELAMLSKHGAGVSLYLGNIRSRGKDITGNGKSSGIIGWCKNYDSTVSSVSQGSTRRGAAALYLDVDHGDIEDFIHLRRPTGDLNLRCLNLNHGVCITDAWMHEMLDGDAKKRKIWEMLLTNRVETGEPYLFFTDNVNRQNPECYKANGLKVTSSNLCTEIFLFVNTSHSFVCCLSSLNLVKYNEWKDTDTVEIAVRFLDAILEEYIRKSENVPGLECSRRSAIKGRALGLGVLGWHSLLQQCMIPFDSFEAMQLNNEIFKTMRIRADAETKRLAEELGEPEWCKGFGRRNTHCLAVAPTVSNSTISGGHSAGIEPIAANIYSQKSAKGTFIRKNPQLEQLLEQRNKNTPEIWRSINEQLGSIQHLDFLTDEEKAVFLTAREINQHAIIKQAAQRQKYIDQGQSVNLFFASNASPKYIHEVHLAAWEQGLKTLYYCRSEGVIRGDLAFRSKEECTACEG